MYTVDRIHDHYSCNRCKGKAAEKHYQNIHRALHCEDGPAHRRTLCEPDSAYHDFQISWMSKGRLHRYGKPAVINNITIHNELVQTKLEWRERGLHHNWYGPALITTDHATGEVIYQWWINGHRFKDVHGWLKMCRLKKPDRVAIKLTYG